MKIRQGLANLQQFPSESIHTFFYRTINTYYRARDAEPKNISEIDNNKIERNDIVFYFVNGIRDENVRNTVKTQLINIDFKDLPDKVKNLSDLVISNEIQKIPVNVVENSKFSQIEQNICELSEKINKILYVKQRKNFKKKHVKGYKSKGQQGSDNKYRKETRRCYECKKIGHLAKNCFSKQAR